MKKFIALGAVIAACATFLPPAFARTTVPGDQGVDRFAKVKPVSRRLLIDTTVRTRWQMGPHRGTRNSSFITDDKNGGSSSSVMNSSVSSSAMSGSSSSTSSSAASSSAMSSSSSSK